MYIENNENVYTFIFNIFMILRSDTDTHGHLRKQCYIASIDITIMNIVFLSDLGLSLLTQTRILAFGTCSYQKG